jgi:hypothetical protein
MKEIYNRTKDMERESKYIQMGENTRVNGSTMNMMALVP